MKGEVLRHWHGFLEDESHSKDGLLCFYDRDRSREVNHWCRVLAESLAAFMAEDGWPEEQEG